MSEDLDATAARLFEGVMAPLALIGPLRPGHAIGARRALALGEGRMPGDRDLAAQVAAARTRRARRIVPIDSVPDPTGAEWVLSAALHDILQAVNPIFDAPLRRSAAVRILDLAISTLEHVAPPASVMESLSRHTWFSRVPDITRMDTDVSWWAGTREFRGVDPPDRLKAWPGVRKVSVVRKPRSLLELTPLAVDRARLSAAVSLLLAQTPLTDLASCSRTAPLFAWDRSSLGLVSTRTGRSLALRALARLDPSQVDGALGRATTELLAKNERASAEPALALLADRALYGVEERGTSSRQTTGNVSLAFALGALTAQRTLTSGDGSWCDEERSRLIDGLRADPTSIVWSEASGLLDRHVE